MENTPKNLGFTTPAEWAPHSAVWLAWPHDEITFPDRVEKVEKTFVEIIQAIHQSEPVNLLVLDERMQSRVRELLEKAEVDVSKIFFYITTYADVWLRDYGPMYIKNFTTTEKAWVKWEYNAYNKFPTLLRDNEVFLNIKYKLEGDMFKPGIVMEGGSIEINGVGALVTTEQCLLNPNRNPNLSKDKIEDYLKDYLGVSKIIWLPEGIINDHTDGHIDDVLKFVNANTILCGYEEDKNDPNFKILDENYKILENSTDQDGKPFNLIKLPMPHMDYDDGTKAPVSYANFYIGNTVVLVPTFNDSNDAKALSIIESSFPDKKIVGINCRDLIYGGGAIHCITCQEPV